MPRLLPIELQQTERRLRIVSILKWAEPVGLSPTSTDVLHSIAYLADVLSPVWHLPALDGQVLKRIKRPFFPRLQHDLDELVGIGLVRVCRFDYLVDDDQQNGATWRVDGEYELRSDRAKPILDAIMRFPEQHKRHEFVREVVYAASGLGSEGLAAIGLLDAAYSDPYVDIGGLLDVEPDDGENLTAHMAQRFATLTAETEGFTSAELVHLYVRHLYARLKIA